jgi:uncharacterized membrane protein YgaE (UPF0421/DUF939 family)
LAEGRKNMNDTNKTYPRFVGVILGFILSGSAHFLSGQRAGGFRWFMALLFIPVSALLILAVPGVVHPF